MRIFGCGFSSRILGCGFFFFADFVMACADFGMRIFSADFLGCFPAGKGLIKNPIKKSHRKILTKGLVREAFLHNTPPHSFWQDTADLLRASGCRCTFSLLDALNIFPGASIRRLQSNPQGGRAGAKRHEV